MPDKKTGLCRQLFMMNPVQVAVMYVICLPAQNRAARAKEQQKT
jgi:hypothetical protein